MLTQAQVTAALRGGKRKIAAGNGIKLVVRNGKGFWTFRYWNGSKVVERGLGSASEVSPAAARRARDDFMAAFRQRPSQMALHLAAGGSGPMFGQAALSYIQAHEAEWSDRGAQHWANCKNHCSAILDSPLKTISKEMVADVLRPIWRGPSSGVGAKLRAFMQRIFKAGRVEPNPATWDTLEDLLSRRSPPSKPCTSMPPQDVPQFLRDLQARPERELARCLTFCILTVARTQEAIDADWSEVHLDGYNGFSGPVWIIPEHRAKMRREHAVPLSPQGVALLGEPRKSGRVFAVTNTRTGAINPGSLLKLIQRMRNNEKPTTHGFRSSFGTWAEQQPNVSVKCIDLCLAHQEASRTRRAYLRNALWAERRELMERWSDYCGVRHRRDFFGRDDERSGTGCHRPAD